MTRRPNQHDLVEVAPPFDVRGITMLTSMTILFEMLWIFMLTRNENGE